MANYYNSVEELIGKTPLIRLEKIEKQNGSKAKIFAKLEGFNPAGSAKDRVALYMIDEAERSGKIKQGTVVIEPTSGNTGIGLSAICASRGYKIVIVMPDNMSEERKMLMRAYGAELRLTPAALGMKGAIAEAERLAGEFESSFIPSQFENPENPKAHKNTTAPEIYDALDGRVDAFICGVGTGGTISGVGEYLKQKNPDCMVFAVEPDTSAVLSGESAGAHKIQGIGAGFIPSILNTGIYDKVIKVSSDDAFSAAKELGKKSGILIGISGGAALSAAIKISKEEKFKDKNIVVLFADSGERYLSSGLFRVNYGTCGKI